MSSPFALGPVTTDHCIAALERAGFVASRFDSGRIVMARGERQIVLVGDRTMQPSELEVVLKAAGVTPEEFAELLTDALAHISGVIANDTDARRPLARASGRGEPG